MIWDFHIINFKNYGSNSSRTRTLVIGVRKDLSDIVVPIELYPDYLTETFNKSKNSFIGEK